MTGAALPTTAHSPSPSPSPGPGPDQSPPYTWAVAVPKSSAKSTRLALEAAGLFDGTRKLRAPGAGDAVVVGSLPLAGPTAGPPSTPTTPGPVTVFPEGTLLVPVTLAYAASVLGTGAEGEGDRPPLPLGAGDGSLSELAVGALPLVRTRPDSGTEGRGQGARHAGVVDGRGGEGLWSGVHGVCAGLG